MFSTLLEIAGSLPSGRPLLLLLDYDGTLVPFAPDPALARPDEALLALLDRLEARPDCRTVIVSGRSGEDLARLFGGRPLRALALHGAQVLEPGRPVQERIDLRAARERARALLRACAPLRSIPGVILEEKGAALCLHTRACRPRDEREAIRRFRDIVESAGDDGTLAWLEGSKVIELRPRGADKGSGALWLLERLGGGWFPLYVGDDATDEDAFRALASRGVTVGVGAPRYPSAARFRIPDTAAVRDLLRLVAERPA